MIDTKELAVVKGIPIKHFPLKPYDYNPSKNVQYIEDLIGPETIEKFIKHFETDSSFYDVGVSGYSDPETEVGSSRVTVYDEGFARLLSTILQNHLKPLILDKFSRVDWQSQNPDELNYAVPLCVSSVFRYMKYKKGGKHFTHYDAPFVIPDNPLIRSLQSGVLYLTTNNCSTRFIKDGQYGLEFLDRNHEDWTREARSEEVEASFRSKKGACLLFNHQFAHDVSEQRDEDVRIIIRFDIMYHLIAKVEV